MKMKTHFNNGNHVWCVVAFVWFGCCLWLLCCLVWWRCCLVVVVVVVAFSRSRNKSNPNQTEQSTRHHTTTSPHQTQQTDKQTKYLFLFCLLFCSVFLDLEQTKQKHSTSKRPLSLTIQIDPCHCVIDSQHVTQNFSVCRGHIFPCIPTKQNKQHNRQRSHQTRPPPKKQTKPINSVSSVVHPLKNNNSNNRNKQVCGVCFGFSPFRLILVAPLFIS